MKQSFEIDSHNEQHFKIKHTFNHNFRLKLGKS